MLAREGYYDTEPGGCRTMRWIGGNGIDGLINKRYKRARRDGVEWIYHHVTTEQFLLFVLGLSAARPDSRLDHFSSYVTVL